MNVKDPDNHILALVVFVFLVGLYYALPKLEERQANTEQWSESTTIRKVYKSPPVLSQCKEGVLKKSENRRILKRINYIRGLHDLSPVYHDPTGMMIDEKIALLEAVNINFSGNSGRHCLNESTEQ